MIVLKVATVFLLALTVGAEKKIELQDIEEDNLRSEKEKELEKSDGRPPTSGAGTGPGLVPLDFLKSGLLRYFETPTPAPQQQRYVHQYAVTEQPERPSPVARVQYAPPAPQQAMVGYLSNVPMQIYLVPQYYSDQSDNHQSHNPHANTQYQPGVARVAAYQTAPEAVQTQSNYIEVPTYVAPTGKAYVQQYSQPVTYVGYPAQPTIAPPQATVTPVVTYQVPVVQYTPAVVAPTTAPKTYYQSPQYSETNSVDEVHDHEEDQRQYSTQTEGPYHKPPPPEFPRHYNSRAPLNDEYRGHPNAISELPHPNPVLIKAPPPHLAHLPKALPIYRPLTKPVYHGSGGFGSNGFTPRPHELYGPPAFKRRPTSLLDSYIPSSLQVEYLKRGIVKEPLAVYDALASGRLPHPIPRHYERGFLPNQMYHTGAGGVTFGHYKRTPKVDKVSHK
ncbi:uncharacterized protein LOC142977232 [Anticarsia gemmatalis]|uniref:uncharacterized protein LOC142977232 n=1 Tax=Anticarsia gemmatalis TaxID=129554 RepID=UPI003F769BDB